MQNILLARLFIYFRIISPKQVADVLLSVSLYLY
jgi:hypothetical protein